MGITRYLVVLIKKACALGFEMRTGIVYPFKKKKKNLRHLALWQCIHIDARVCLVPPPPIHPLLTSYSGAIHEKGRD